MQFLYCSLARYTPATHTGKLLFSSSYNDDSDAYDDKDDDVRDSVLNPFN